MLRTTDNAEGPEARASRPVPPAPDLALPTPERGLVHPFGDVPAEDLREEPNVDVPTWTCATCGFQWDRKLEPRQCPNCAATDGFVKMQ